MLSEIDVLFDSLEKPAAIPLACVRVLKYYLNNAEIR